MSSKRIGMVHYKVLGTDGVSLEMDKWKVVLEGAGHQVFYISGQISDREDIVHPELYHLSDTAVRLYRYSFAGEQTFEGEQEYRQVLYTEAQKVEQLIGSWIDEHRIELLIPQNIWSVAMNPAVAIGVQEACRDRQLEVLAQHHDFYWERFGQGRTDSPTARILMEEYLPPKDRHYRHVVINSYAQGKLKERRGIESSVIPNVFDLSQPAWHRDAYNADYRRRLGIAENDIVILQATRIVKRKAIELAIDTAAEIRRRRSKLIGRSLYDGRTFGEDSQIILLLAGYSADDDTGNYLKRLTEHAAARQVKLICSEDMTGHSRALEGGKKIYSLWDAYAHADLISYPSYWEGWGNQLLEGIFAKKPIIIFEYPVFLEDIQQTGLQLISLGSSYETDPLTGLVRVDQKYIERAAEASIELLIDAKERSKVVEANFATARRYYSTDALKQYLLPLIP